MGDLIQDTDVVSSIINPDNVLTVGFLNEKVMILDYSRFLDFIVVVCPFLFTLQWNLAISQTHK
jgi:hypothetical protein